MEPKVIRIEIKVTRTMVTVLAGLLLVALALLAVTSAGALPPLEGPGGQGGVTLASAVPITVPMMISYQGQLLDSGGNLVPDGTYSMTFKLYNVASGGTAFWEETHPNVEVTDGLFNVMLGARIPFEPDDFIGTTYLGVTVGSDPEMIPRQQMVSVPYAFRAAIADQAIQADNDWCGAGTGKMYTCNLNDDVGIGVDDPQQPPHHLEVRGGNAGPWALLVEANNLADDTGARLEFNGANSDGILNILAGTFTPDVFPHSNPAIKLHPRTSGVNRAILVVDDYDSQKFKIRTQGNEDKGNRDGKDVLTITQEGNVGIGTNNPSHPLTVRSGGFQDAIRTLKEHIPGGEWGVVIGAASPQEGNGGRIFGYNPAIGPSSDNAEGWVDLFINSFGRHTILNLHYGNVGIGTTSPTAKLQVAGTTLVSNGGIETIFGTASTPGYRFMGTGVNMGMLAAATNELAFSTNSAERMRINSAGNVGIGTTNPTVKLDVIGDIHKTGLVSFVQPHPTDPTKEIVYVSLEGPEAGTYIRGTAQLVNGEAVISLPKHFSLVTNDEGLTVQLTPVGEWLQLYVVEKGTQRIIVREANGKNGQFDYLVQGVRKGYEDYQVIQERR